MSDCKCYVEHMKATPSVPVSELEALKQYSGGFDELGHEIMVVRLNHIESLIAKARKDADRKGGAAMPLDRHNPDQSVKQDRGELPSAERENEKLTMEQQEWLIQNGRVEPSPPFSRAKVEKELDRMTCENHGLPLRDGTHYGLDLSPSSCTAQGAAILALLDPWLPKEG